MTMTRFKQRGDAGHKRFCKRPFNVIAHAGRIFVKGLRYGKLPGFAVRLKYVKYRIESLFPGL